MRALATIALAALVTVPALAGDVRADPPSPLPAAQAAAMAKKVEDFYDKTTSFSSEFSQKFVVKAHNVTKKSSGHVVFSKPGKMSWDYKDPPGERVVSDGTTLKVYSASNHQMLQQSVSATQFPAALSFLMGGTGRLTTSYDFALYEGKDADFPEGQVLRGTPKVATPAFATVYFYVDTQTSQVRRVLVVDAQGNHNRFDFQAAKVNETIPASTFTFTPPAGTTIVNGATATAPAPQTSP